jgi:hypothetical protein
MSLMSMLSAAQGGQLFAKVAQSLDLDEAETRKAMGKLCPALARQLRTAAEDDEDLYKSLLELIADGAQGSPLEDPEAITGPEGLADGNAILEDIYGSRNDAMIALRKVAADTPERELAKLAPISATAVVAALAHANQPAAAEAVRLAGTQQAQGSSDSGLVGTLINAIIAGAVSGIMREITSATRRSTTSYRRSRSRRTTASTSRTRKRKTTTTRKRSTAGISIEDIFRDLLGGKTS